MNDTMKKLQSEVAAAFAAGQSSQHPHVIEDAGTRSKHLLIPDGDGGWKREDLSGELERPRRVAQTMRFVTAESFVAYVKAYSTPSSIVMCKPPMAGNSSAGTFVAILDYHEQPTAPAWCCHRAFFTLPPTKAWADWRANSGKPMDQVAFAQFLEDRIPEILRPEGSVLVGLARTFEALSSVTFKSVDVARDGSRVLKYEELIQDVSQPGKAPLPEEIAIYVPIFEGQAPLATRARIRFTLKAGVLQLRYELIRPEDVEREGFLAALEVIDVGLKGSVRGLFHGTSFTGNGAGD